MPYSWLLRASNLMLILLFIFRVLPINFPRNLSSLSHQLCPTNFPIMQVYVVRVLAKPGPGGAAGGLGPPLLCLPLHPVV